MGRKPKHDKPMTSTERTKAYRKRKMEEGFTELHFTISNKLAKQIDELVKFYGLTGRAQVITDLLQFPISLAAETMQEWKSNPDLPEQGQDESDAVKEAKHLMWNKLALSLQEFKEVRNQMESST